MTWQPALSGAVVRVLRAAAGRRALRTALVLGGLFALGLLCGQRAHAAEPAPAAGPTQATATAADAVTETLGSAVAPGSPGAAVAPVARSVASTTRVAPDVASTRDDVNPRRVLTAVDARVAQPVSEVLQVLGHAAADLGDSTPVRSLPALPAPPSLPALSAPPSLAALPAPPSVPAPSSPLPSLPPLTGTPSLPSTSPLPGTPSLPGTSPLPGTPSLPGIPQAPVALPAPGGQGGAGVRSPLPHAPVSAPGADAHVRPFVGTGGRSLPTPRVGPAAPITQPRPYVPVAAVLHVPVQPAPAGDASGALVGGTAAGHDTPRHGDAHAVTPRHELPLPVRTGTAARCAVPRIQDRYRDIPVFPA